MPMGQFKDAQFMASFMVIIQNRPDELKMNNRYD